MKGILSKAKTNSKKVVIHLKRHHKKYLFGALCSGVLALIGLHTASTINSTFADEEVPVVLNSENLNKLCNVEDDGLNISCEGQEIESVENGAFSLYSDKIKSIDLSKNKISFIDKGVFDELSLENLDLSYNNLSEIDSYVFEGIVGLKSLNLSFNQIFNLELQKKIAELNTLNLEENCLSEDKINTLMSILELSFENLIGSGEQKACFYISYNPSSLTNQDVIATIVFTGEGEFIGDLSNETGFTETGTKYFDVVDFIEKSGYILNYPENNKFPATVTWIDKIVPTCDTIEYSTTGLTNQNVTAILTGCSESITVINNSGNMRYTFENTGSFTFEFRDAAGNTGSTTATVTWIDKTAPNCPVEYRLIDLDTIIAYITGCDEEIFQIDENMPLTYIFYHNGKHEFWFSDRVGNLGKRSFAYYVSGNITGFTTTGLSSLSYVVENNIVTINWDTTDTGWLEADLWDEETGEYKYLQGVELNSKMLAFPINKTGTYVLKLVPNGNEDKKAEISVHVESLGTGFTLTPVTIPNCSINYSTQSPTNSGVVAYLTGCNENISGNELSHTFYETGYFTFIYKNSLNNYWYNGIIVDWIDKVAPTCDVQYSTTGATIGNVTATLTGCSETITGTNTQHTFTGNGTYTFNFQDLAGNTGVKEATVTWIITYFDVEGNIFTWNDLTICNPDNSGECITMMDRNMGATTNDVSKTGSYGYKYQWGNNYGFKDGCWRTTGCSDDITSGALELMTNGAEWKNIYNNSGYYGNVFIKGGLNTYWSDHKVHNHLWGGGNDNSGSNWGYPVTNPTDRQGPCPQGYHVPSAGERSNVIGRWIEKSDTGLRAQGYKDPVTSLNWISDNSGSYAFHNDFNISLAGIRHYNSGNLGGFGEYTSLWTSTAPGNETVVVSYYFGRSHVEAGKGGSSLFNRGVSEALPVRCFKNNANTGYNSSNEIVDYFYVNAPERINVGEYVNFVVKAIKDGKTLKNFSGMVFLWLKDSRGKYVDEDYFDIFNGGWYQFRPSDQGRKIFTNGLRIKRAGTYTLEVESPDGGGMGDITIVVSGYSNDVVYDEMRFNPHFSSEENQAYQYAYYYGITTKSSIKEANMYSGLTRVAMAKMLSQYAINALGIRDFNTSRNCTFKDVSSSLDKQYDDGVTKACQLGIMGINMPDNKFYPNGYVTRAEFATALSRLLYNTKDGSDKYYSTHISKLRKEGIITNTDPTLKELRGYVMLMLMRAAEK